MKLNTKHAFSIVEVCVACGILMVGLLPVIGMLRQGSSGTISSRTEIKARMYASNLVSRCKLLPFGHDYLKECGPSTASSGLDLKIGALTFDVSVKEPIIAQTLEIRDFKSSADWPYNYKLIIAADTFANAGSTASRSICLAGLMSKWKD